MLGNFVKVFDCQHNKHEHDVTVFPSSFKTIQGYKQGSMLKVCLGELAKNVGARYDDQ